MASALRVLANAVRPLKAGDHDSIAALLGSFVRNPDSRVVLAGLLANLDLANASSQTEASAQSYSSAGG